MAKTKFDIPERYDPKTLEPRVLKFWDTVKLAEHVKTKNKSGKKYYFLDGPPYANGPPHAGHARTRALRDPILKYWLMSGYDVRLQPGYDCHGLPIEVKVEEEIGTRHKLDIEEFGAEKFIDKCRERAKRFVGVFNEFWKRFGMHWDFENPYLTMDQSYVDSSWLFFKKAHEKKLLYRGQATVAWCPRCETPLSGYEATDEYRETTDTSIYVKFRLKQDPTVSLLVWTTTPWTIPGNLAISVNPGYKYARVKIGEESVILAKDLVGSIMKRVGVEKYAVEEELDGKKLEGLLYEHPLLEEIPALKKLKKVHSVTLADWVTLEEGTGCVHTAPAFGTEDYSTGMKYSLPLFSPVDDKGEYTAEAGKYKGLFVFDANSIVIHDLKEKKSLVHEEPVHHRYPHCWRCKHPLIYKASKQWFVKIDPIRKKMLEENGKVVWIPDYAGSKRFKDWINNARDWCISRQRFWGIPLPIWECSKCGDYQVFGSFSEVEKVAKFLPGGDKDLHKPWIDNVIVLCPKCGAKTKRVKDIADVWFDSGASTWASLNYPEDPETFKKLFPADFITEGLDQTRGWFYTLLVESIVAFDKSPYKKVLMNGFVLDENGNKMSKSKGNVVEPMEVIEKYGADVFRLYLLWETQPWDALKFNYRNVDIVSKSFNILWNVYRFVEKYFLLYKFDTHKFPYAKQKPYVEDEWIVSRTNSVLKELTKELSDSQNMFSASRSLLDFVSEDLSRGYVRLLRSRLKQKDNLEACFSALFYVFERLTHMLAPFAPFMAEVLYQRMLRKEETMVSVHLSQWPAVEENRIKKDLEEEMRIVRNMVEAGFSLRQAENLKLKLPLQHAIVITKKEKCKKAIQDFDAVIRDQLNVKDISIEEAAPTDYKTSDFAEGKLYLDTTVTDELKREGLIREIVRKIQAMRKELSLNETQKIHVDFVSSAPEELMLEDHAERLKNEANVEEILSGKEPQLEGGLAKTYDFLGKQITLIVVRKEEKADEKVKSLKVPKIGEKKMDEIREVMMDVMQEIRSRKSLRSDIDISGVIRDFIQTRNLQDQNIINALTQHFADRGLSEDISVDQLTKEVSQKYESSMILDARKKVKESIKEVEELRKKEDAKKRLSAEVKASADTLASTEAKVLLKRRQKLQKKKEVKKIYIKLGAVGFFFVLALLVFVFGQSEIRLILGMEPAQQVETSPIEAVGGGMSIEAMLLLVIGLFFTVVTMLLFAAFISKVSEKGQEERIGRYVKKQKK